MSKRFMGVKKVVIPMMVMCVLLLQGGIYNVSANDLTNYSGSTAVVEQMQVSEENVAYNSALGVVDGGVYVDGTKLDFRGVEPFIRDGRTLVPIAVIARELGAEVEWNPENRIVGFEKDGDIILLQIGSRQVTVNGQRQQIEVPAEINDSRTYVPLRFVSEQLKARVEWENDTRTIRIYTDGEEETEVPPVVEGEELSVEESKRLYEEHFDVINNSGVYKNPGAIDESIRIEVVNFIQSNSEYTAKVAQGAVVQLLNGRYSTYGIAERNNNGKIEQADAVFTVSDGYHAGEGHNGFVSVNSTILSDWR